MQNFNCSLFVTDGQVRRVTSHLEKLVAMAAVTVKLKEWAPWGCGASSKNLQCLLYRRWRDFLYGVNPPMAHRATKGSPPVFLVYLSSSISSMMLLTAGNLWLIRLVFQLWTFCPSLSVCFFRFSIWTLSHYTDINSGLPVPRTKNIQELRSVAF